MIIKGDFEPVFETGTNPDAGRFVFRLKDPDASSRTEKVVYSIGSDVQTTAVIPTNGVYSFTVPASGLPDNSTFLSCEEIAVP